MTKGINKNIQRNEIEKYANENYLTDKKQVIQQQREELAESS